ncbi:response regulator [Pusillimonas sp. T2]|uniref:ANTAR domain-containing response regulator n=1 Tax=Pusillimonas sp. T2 TaxID=1548123 RepID=UPI000B946598|nr:response regulator [Pusillimonas sp. T2]OXR50504.1 response regulator [Pusillimonas sp. T2]
MTPQPSTIAAAPHLLVVDDDRLVLATLSKGLKYAGFTVSEAYSGEQALQLLQDITPDLAILDISMPGVSGLDVARQLRANTQIPFIFLTAYGDEETVKEATESGAVGYLVKPIDTAQLIPAIKAGLARAADIVELQRSEAQLNHALESSREISIAVGIIMERARLDHEKAFQALRSQARRTRRQVQDLAKSLIAAHETLSQFDA